MDAGRKTSDVRAKDEQLQKDDDTTLSARRCGWRRARYSDGALHDGRESTACAESAALRQRSRVHARDRPARAPTLETENAARSNRHVRAFSAQPAHQCVESSNLFSAERATDVGARQPAELCAHFADAHADFYVSAVFAPYVATSSSEIYHVIDCASVIAQRGDVLEVG
ncbi:hypothetical protein NECAME_03831 [Necator americanus]|uniref:Uncharacterized protein n=1 Tax=Necator americanus TaxID=51031 RepID=W2SZN5_NECAM|nr:hypothetical protein NECAME_03831 [Necator americanus]ETN75108.1 hypothetical protein NECAME_03831 [Necator americanus]